MSLRGSSGTRSRYTDDFGGDRSGVSVHVQRSGDRQGGRARIAVVDCMIVTWNH